MARTKKFNDFIDRLPETGTELITLWEWIIRNHFNDTTIYPDPSQEKVIAQCKYTKQSYKYYIIYLYIFTKDKHHVYPFLDFQPLYVKGIASEIIDYLKYEKKHETAPIIFKEYSKGIERNFIRYFVMEIYDLEHRESIKIDF